MCALALPVDTGGRAGGVGPHLGHKPILNPHKPDKPTGTNPPHHGNKIPVVTKHSVNMKGKSRLDSTNRPHSLLNLLDAVYLGMRMVNPATRKHLPRNANVPGVPHLEVPPDSVMHRVHWNRPRH